MKVFFLAAVVFFFVAVPYCCFAFDDGDFQYWNNEGISWKINDKFKMSFEEELRFGDDSKDFYYRHSDIGITYSGLASWLAVGIFYRHIWEEKSGDWKEENRPHFDATLTGKLAGWGLSSRGRFAYRNREDAEDFWQYQNKFTVKLPWKFSHWQIQPYIADEIYYDFDQETLNRNRLYGGFSLSLSENLKAEIFYLWQRSEKNDAWSDINVVGTKLKLSF